MTGLLKGKVVVISGVGPALGTTLAHRCARDGAELVRLGENAKDFPMRKASREGDHL